MDKFKQKMMTKKLRLSPNDVVETEVAEYIHSQNYSNAAIEEIHIIINNPLSDIRPSVKAKINGVIVKALKVRPRDGQSTI